MLKLPIVWPSITDEFIATESVKCTYCGSLNTYSVNRRGSLTGSSSESSLSEGYSLLSEMRFFQAASFPQREFRIASAISLLLTP